MNKLKTKTPFLKRITSIFKPFVKSEKSGSYFAITISLFTLSFFGLFAIRPTLLTAVNLIRSVNTLKELNEKYELKINSIIKTQSEFENVRNDLFLIDIALPENSLFSKLALALEKMADRSNVTIQQLQMDKASISKLPPSNQVQNYNFSLVTSGDFPSSIAYLTSLINAKRIITLQSLDFNKDSSGTTSANIRLTIRAQAYYEP
jgi:hypothetical protein